MVSVAPSGVQKHLCAILGSRDIDKSKLDKLIRNFRYWLIFVMNSDVSYCFVYISASLCCTEMGLNPKHGCIPPTKMFRARKIRNKSDLRYQMESSFQILEI